MTLPSSFSSKIFALENITNMLLKLFVKLARAFFKKYKVLFAAVWELVLDPPELQDYFRKLISFSGMLKEFHGIDKDVYEAIQSANNVIDLETIVRKLNAFNMND